MAVTLLQLRDAAKDLSDMVNNPQVGDPTWTRWINDGIERLYRIAIRRNVGPFQTFANFTLTAASNLFTMTAGWRRVIGVSMDPTVPASRRSLPKYNLGERDGGGLFGPRSYRVVSSTQLAIEPFQLCAGNYRLYYVAGPTVLVADGDPIDVILEPYDDYVTTWAAIRALGKDESDNRDLYKDLEKLEEDVDQAFANLDGDDPSTVVDDDNRGPNYFNTP